VTNNSPSGENVIFKIHALCNWVISSSSFASGIKGVSVSISQNLSIASPPPEQSKFPSGENCTVKILSVCPSRTVPPLVNGFTRNKLSGQYTILYVVSLEKSFIFFNVSAKLFLI